MRNKLLRLAVVMLMVSSQLLAGSVTARATNPPSPPLPPTISLWLFSGTSYIQQYYGCTLSTLEPMPPDGRCAGSPDGSRWHSGTDIAGGTVGCGTNLYGGTHGIVTYVFIGTSSQTSILEWRLDNGTYVDIFHMQAINVSVGQAITAATLLGQVGNYGNSTGCHIHFQINDSNHAVGSYEDWTETYPMPWLIDGSSNPVPWAEWGRVKGDFNGDGIEDVAVVYQYPNYEIKIWVFLGLSGGGFQSPQPWYDSGPNGFDVKRAKVVAGQFVGSGRTDIAFLYDLSASGCLQHSELIVYPSQSNNTFGSQQVWWDGNCNNLDWQLAKLTVGDYNGDGKSDISILYPYYDCWQHTKILTYISSGTAFTGYFWWDSGCSSLDWSYAKVTSGNFSSHTNGTSDIAILYGYNDCLAHTKWLVFVSNGVSGFSMQSWWDGGCNNADWLNAKISSGNYSGHSNRTSDLLILLRYGDCAQHVKWLTYVSNGSSLTGAFWYDNGCNNFDWQSAKLVSGDFNGAGRSSVAALYAYSDCASHSKWIVYVSSGGSFSPSIWWDSLCGNWDWNLSTVT
jgi:hypothetical protein